VESDSEKTGIVTCNKQDPLPGRLRLYFSVLCSAQYGF
jgi:hypothetical protein